MKILSNIFSLITLLALVLFFPLMALVILLLYIIRRLVFNNTIIHHSPIKPYYREKVPYLTLVQRSDQK